MIDYIRDVVSGGIHCKRFEQTVLSTSLSQSARKQCAMNQKETLQGCEWRPFPHKYYKDHYVVSDTGLVYSKIRGVILKQFINEWGYKTVSVCVNYKSKTFSVHRLVALAFLPNPDNLPQVNHKCSSGDKTNNNISNLEWTTAKGNTGHAWKYGLAKPKVGQNHHKAKLNNSKVYFIKVLLNIGCDYKDISQWYGVARETISSIKIGKNWKHIQLEESLNQLQ